MKQLLACLFLVTALVFSISTKANALFFSKYFCINNPDTIEKTGYYFGKASKKEKCYGYALSKKNNKQLVSNIGWMANQDTKELARLGHPNKTNTYGIISRRINTNELDDWNKFLRDVHGIGNTVREPTQTQQVVKKEPTQTQQVAKKKKKKTKQPKIFKKKEKEVIKIEDIYALGTPIKIEDLPEGMIKVFGKSCIKFFCRTNKATRIMSRSFSRGENYNARHPDNMIKAMAYFELFYMGQLRKNRYELAKYNKYHDKKKQMSGIKALFFKETENKMRSLIGSNKGRKAMREALGMTIELDPATAIKRFWALGELLALGEPKKIEVHEDMKERAEIMKRYAAILGKMQKKLEEEKEEKEKKEKTE